jgi:S1-C subfamily serine protease
MRNDRLLLLTGGFMVCLLAVPRRSDAQERIVYYTYSTNSADMPACRGFTSVHRAVWSKDKKRDSLNVSFPIVTELDPDSPAGRGGVQNGDSLVTINRFTTIGDRDPELSLWNIEVGDLNRVDVRRGSQTVSLTFRMGEWMTAPSGGGAPRVCRNAK